MLSKPAFVISAGMSHELGMLDSEMIGHIQLVSCQPTGHEPDAERNNSEDYKKESVEGKLLV